MGLLRSAPVWAWMGPTACLAGFVALLGGFSSGAIHPLVGGDGFYPYLVMRDAFSPAGASGWRLGTALFVFPDYLVAGSLSLLVPSPMASWAFVFLSGLAVGWGWALVWRRSGLGPQACALVFSLSGLWWALAGAGVSALSLTGWAFSHGGLWSLLPWLLLSSPLCGARRPYALGCLLVLSGASNLLTLVWFSAPCALALALMALAGRLPWRSAALWGLICLASTGIGHLLAPAAPVESGSDIAGFVPGLVLSRSAAGRLLDWTTAQGVRAVFWLGCLALTLAAAGRELRRGGEAPGAGLGLSFFLLLSVASSLAAVLLTGRIPGDYPLEAPGLFPRYFFPALLLPLYGAAAFLCRVRRGRLAPALAVSCMAFSLAMGASSWGRVDASALLADRFPSQSCVREAARRLGWSGGIAPFGLLYPLMVERGSPLERLVVADSFNDGKGRLTLFSAWLASNRDWHEGEFQFVAITDVGGRVYRHDLWRSASDLCSYETRRAECLGEGASRFIDASTARRVFGPPQERVVCEGLEFWHYNPPIYVFARGKGHLELLRFSR